MNVHPGNTVLVTMPSYCTYPFGREMVAPERRLGNRIGCRPSSVSSSCWMDTQGGILLREVIRQSAYDMEYSDEVGTRKPRLGTNNLSGGDCVNSQLSKFSSRIEPTGSTVCRVRPAFGQVSEVSDR